jgi:hypothetical protein
LVLLDITGKIFFFSVVDYHYQSFIYAFGALIDATFILATLYAYVFQKPKDIETWFILATIWGFNIFTLLFSAGLIDFGKDTRPGVFLGLVLITSIVNCLTYFPYNTFEKPELKSQ